MRREWKQKWTIGLLLVVLLSGFFSPITAFAISESGNFANVPDDYYEKANLLATIEEELLEIGLSFETLSKTSIDFQNLAYESQFPTQDYSTRNLPNVMDVIPFNFPDVKRFAAQIYGQSPTNTQLMHTFMLYYFDVHDYDRNLGLVGDRLPARYLPRYYTFNDTNSYNAFLNTTTGTKYLNFAVVTHGVTTDLKSYFSNISLYDMRNHASNVKKTIGLAKGFLDSDEIYDDVNRFLTQDIATVSAIHSPERFMEEIADIIDMKETVDQVTKNLIRDMYTTVLDSVFLLVMGANPVGLAGIATMYARAAVTMYISVIDLAAINALAYTRNSRLNFRQLNEWGMW